LDLVAAIVLARKNGQAESEEQPWPAETPTSEGS
jgi:hypothetical protein